MKKTKHIPMLLNFVLIGSALVACAPKNAGDILIPRILSENISATNYTIAITRSRLEAFTNSGRSFILYFMHPQCSHCRELAPRIENYVRKTNVEIYKVDASLEDYTVNSEFYSDLLGNATPTIAIFKNGEMVKKEVGTSKFKSNVAVLNYFGENIKYTNFFIKNENYNIPTNRKAATFTFNFNDVAAQSIFNTNFYPLITNEKIITYLEDNPLAANELTLSFTNDVATFDLLDPMLDIDNVKQYFTNYFA